MKVNWNIASERVIMFVNQWSLLLTAQYVHYWSAVLEHHGFSSFFLLENYAAYVSLYSEMKELNKRSIYKPKCILNFWLIAIAHLTAEYTRGILSTIKYSSESPNSVAEVPINVWHL